MEKSKKILGSLYINDENLNIIDLSCGGCGKEIGITQTSSLKVDRLDGMNMVIAGACYDCEAVTWFFSGKQESIDKLKQQIRVIPQYEMFHTIVVSTASKIISTIKEEDKREEDKEIEQLIKSELEAWKLIRKLENNNNYH